MNPFEFCFQCGHRIESDNRFCDNCGIKTDNESSSNFQSSDNFLIGKIIEIIDKNNRISYSDIINLAGKADRADRLVARLENTNFFKILKENSKYFVIKIRDKKLNNDISSNINEFIIKNLENFIQMGPILISSISGLMGIPENESEILVNYLINNKKGIYYTISKENNRFIALRT
ncbi:MAG: hypothetical protein HeimC3_02380 [Candidatus Heimdallarchaeota archaeon LC_3]|nr:MAG: hypothetical protein HeimC3_02380 [Candidatus Heimdallarchaeota archaeon LC_3]